MGWDSDKASLAKVDEFGGLLGTAGEIKKSDGL